MYGWCGRILRVDLTRGRITTEALDPGIARDWIGGRGFGILLITPRAGGVGLTLTRANHVIHLSRWWNPAVEDQCNGRVLRIGQERPVTIHLPLAILPDGRPSFDQNLDALLERKRRLHAETLAPPAAEDNELEALFETTVGRGA